MQRETIDHDDQSLGKHDCSVSMLVDPIARGLGRTVVHNSAGIFNNGAAAHAGLTFERPDLLLRAYWMQMRNDLVIESHPLLGNLFVLSDRFQNPQAHFTGQTYNVELQHTLRFGPSFHTIYGANYRRNSLSSNFLDQFAQEDRLGFFVQQEWTPVRPVTFVAGVRYDLNTFIHATVSPRLAVLVRPAENHTFRASLSVGYRPPTLLETHAQQLTLLIFNPPGVPPSKIEGNRNMIPEQLLSYEIGYQGWFFAHRLRTRVDGFYNILRDLQDPLFNSETRTLTFSNAPGKASLYGMEAGVELLLTSWLDVFANLSYTKVDNTFVGNVERVAPRFKVNAGLRAKFDNGLTGDVLVHYVDHTSYPFDSDFRFAPLFGNETPTRRQGGYTLLNLRGAYTFWKQYSETGVRREAEVAFSVFNALNDSQQEHPLGDLLGTRVRGWLTVRI